MRAALTVALSSGDSEATVVLKSRAAKVESILKMVKRSEMRQVASHHNCDILFTSEQTLDLSKQVANGT